MVQYYNLMFVGNFLTKLLSWFFCINMTFSNKAIRMALTCLFTVNLGGFALTGHAEEIRIATFNVSMEGTNYGPRGAQGTNELARQLKTGENSQIQNIAAIIQRIRPDVILLNEFDYIVEPQDGAIAFIENYLKISQHGAAPIHYPYFFYAPVNTGHQSGFDLDNDGVVGDSPNDAWGFGHYEGQYGMLLLSRFPIDKASSRTFKNFLWKDLPGANVPRNSDGSPYYSEKAWSKFPLSSKSHWDVSVLFNDETVHILASHPTPPVFDGPENRNGLRNQDEIHFWSVYLDEQLSNEFVDDQGRQGGLRQGARFVVLGDLNASPNEGDGLREGIRGLLSHRKVADQQAPISAGALAANPRNPTAASHTASWGMRADYVIPSRTGWSIVEQGVFWPNAADKDYFLVKSRSTSSDHRLVWQSLQWQPHR